MGDGRIWHYIDGAGTQAGPVDAAELRAALQAGKLALDHVAWREGMANWRPLRELAADLGLAAPAGAMPPPPPTGADAANPYDPMPHAGLVFRERSQDVVYAGFLRRWVALWLDQMIAAVPLIAALVALGLVGGVKSGEEPGAAFVLVYLLWFVFVALYYALQESSSAQATLGKRALGIKVTDAEGRRLGFGHALGRWFAAALSYLTFYIGFLMAAGTQRKQALHDFVAGTLVVDRWAYTDHPERQRQNVSGCLIAVVVALAIVPIIAILAAIAISQYSDYVVRSQVSEGVSLVDNVQASMADFAAEHGRFPASNEEAGLPPAAEFTGTYVSSIAIEGNLGHIVVTYSAQPPRKANASIDGSHLVFTPTLPPGDIVWSCASDDLEQKNCPSRCECTGGH